MEGVSPGSRFPRRPSQAPQSVLDLRQQPHHARRPGDWSFTEDVASVSRPTAGTSRTSPTPMISIALRKAYNNFLQTNDRPTLIIVNSHIGYGSPHKQDTNAAHGEAAGRRRSQTGQEILRLAGRCQVPGSRWRARKLPRGHRQTRRAISTRNGRLFTKYKQQVSRPRQTT